MIVTAVTISIVVILCLGTEGGDLQTNRLGGSWRDFRTALRVRTRDRYTVGHRSIRVSQLVSDRHHLILPSGPRITVYKLSHRQYICAECSTGV